MIQGGTIIIYGINGKTKRSEKDNFTEVLLPVVVALINGKPANKSGQSLL